MLIDWFTVGAQALNFIILVWLLKRFLYQPILNAIDAREQRIGAQLADAQAKKAEASAERDEFHRKNEALEQQRATLVRKATEEASVERQRLIGEARAAAEALSAKRQAALRDDADNLSHAIRRHAQQEVFAIARKALTDLATTGLEECICEVFVRRLGSLDGKTKQDLGAALKTSAAPALVRSAFELPAAQRAALQSALDKAFAAEVPLRFEVEPDLVSGIEFVASGQKIAWSISNYLTSMKKGVDELLEERDQSEHKAEAMHP